MFCKIFRCLIVYVSILLPPRWSSSPLLLKKKNAGTWEEHWECNSPVETVSLQNIWELRHTNSSERRALFYDQLLRPGWFKRYFTWSCAMLINTSIFSRASCVTAIVTVVKDSWPVFRLVAWTCLSSLLSFTSEFSVCGGGKSLKNTINFFPSLLVCGGCRP